ncbi:MAG: hypothetical protein EBR15_07500 [Gammaproteobacteria bacterium]|jgi:hypothetical protein|nr:hypothetical protein [Gammaproteobacteria bacterium]NBX41247.1 hypothetical protein [Gammaproteobacteria bacterium]
MRMEMYSVATVKAPAFDTPTQTYRVGHQSWTLNNLCVPSYHNDIPYFTTRWDALCPYITVSEEMLACAKRPLIVYALPPDSPYGVPINDKYGLVDLKSAAFWGDARRIRKFAELEKRFREFRIETTVVPGSTLDVSTMMEMGGEHFEKCEIEIQEIEGFLDYVRNLDVLVIRATHSSGELAFTDVSILMPEYDQIYGSFCQWNENYRNRSPGLYACLAVCHWGRENGYRYYNLGPVGDYNYKELFVTDLQPIYAIAMIEPGHPLLEDPTSPINTDFPAGGVNKLHRRKFELISSSKP